MLRLMVLVATIFRMATIARALESNPPAEPREKPKPSDLVTQFNGDAVRMAERLADVMDDNHKTREKNRTLQTENERLKGNQKPENAVILTGDDVKAYEAYRAFGKPEDIQARLTERDTLAGERDGLATKLAGLERDGTFRDAARRYDYDFDALRAHAGELPLTAYEVEEERDGKRDKVIKYRIAEGNAQVDLAEWASKQPAFVQRALTPTTGQQQATGAFVPPMGSQTTGPTSPLDDFLKGRNEAAAARPNPLASKTP